MKVCQWGGGGVQFLPRYKGVGTEGLSSPLLFLPYVEVPVVTLVLPSLDSELNN